MEEASRSSDPSNKIVIPRAHRLMRGLAWLYAIAVLTVGTWITLGLLPPKIKIFGYEWGFAPGLHEMAHDWVVGGLGAIVLPTLLLALTTSVATLALTGTRFRYAAALETQPAETQQSGGSSRRWDRRIAAFFRAVIAYFRSIKANPGIAAPAGTSRYRDDGCGARMDRGVVAVADPGVPDRGIRRQYRCGVRACIYVAGGGALCKRVPGAPVTRAPTVRRLLFFSTLMLVAAACLEMGHNLGVSWVHWLALAVALLPGMIMLELTVRALARLFLPPPLPEAATSGHG